MHPNVENFIGCDSSYRAASIVLYGAPYDSTTSYRPGARFGPAAIRHESYGLETYSPYQNADLTDFDVFDSGDLELCFGSSELALADIEARAEEILKDGKFPLLLSAKTQAESLCGLEIQADSADMARRSVAMNHLEDRISVIQGDIKEADKLFAAASFDVVMSNPPYMIGQHGLTNPEAPKAIARHEVLCTFEDIAAQTARLLAPGGSFYLVHRPFRLAELIVTLSKYKLEPKRMQLVYPYADREPNMVLLQAVRGGKPRMTVEKPLVIYKEPGVYTEEIYGIYGY